MKLSAKKSKGKSAMKLFKRSSERRYRVAIAALCVLMIGTSTMGALAVEVPATDDPVSSEKTIVPAEAETDDGTLEEEPSVPVDEEIDQSEDHSIRDVHITAWKWVDEEEFLQEEEGKWYLALPGADGNDLTEDVLKEMLPTEIQAELSDGKEEKLPITWDFSALNEDAKKGSFCLKATISEDYELAEGVSELSVMVEAGGAEIYENYPGTRIPLTGDDNFEDHTVQGITPAGTTINLFDYDPKIGSSDDDRLPDVAKFEDYSNGINQGALLRLCHA